MTADAPDLAHIPVRPPALDEARLSPGQRAAYDAIRSGPRGVVEGPLRVWVQSPELAGPAQALGAYCRYGTRLPPRLSELAILVVGAHWRSGFEWHVHAPLALDAGLDPGAVEAIRTGLRPDLADPAERAVWAFADELLRGHGVSDDTYAVAVGELGLPAVVDLVGILGYYTLISMTINAFRVPVPPGAADPFAGPPPDAAPGRRAE
jgi:4-carboxymuconolactone decarboxylase